MEPSCVGPLLFTTHARRRMSARRISVAAVEQALRWGREYWSRGDLVYRLDRRSVRRAAVAGFRLERHEGVTVVTSLGGIVITVWRTRRPRRIYR